MLHNSKAYQTTVKVRFEHRRVAEASLNRASFPVRELSAKAVNENPAKYDYVTAIHGAAAAVY